MRAVRLMGIGLLALLAIACGDDKDENKDPTEGESSTCTRVLDELQACMDSWCAGDGAGNEYCGCYDSDAVLQRRGGEPCSCTDDGTWRAYHRTLFCTPALPSTATVDCEQTKAELTASTQALCG